LGTQPAPRYGHLKVEGVDLTKCGLDVVARMPVYYLGVPDTTPEFTTEAALGRYLASTPSSRR